MNKTLFIILISIVSVPAYSSSDVEIPLLKLNEMDYNVVINSSKPELLIRQFEYKSTASPEELLDFYKKSKYTEFCRYNKLANNYLCYLAKYGEVSSGVIAIPSKSKNGLTEVFADYFYLR